MNEAIFHKRRSVRVFSSKKVESSKLKKIIEAGNLAPSACDFQLWRVIVITDNKIKERIVNEGAASFIKNAPVCMVIAYSNQTDNQEYIDYIQSASAFIENMLLMAVTLGIYGCWICHLPPKDKMREILCIPKEYDPIAAMVLGYPKAIPKPRPRKHTTDEIISYNKFDFEVESRYMLPFKRIARKIYYKMPGRKYIKPLVDAVFEKKFEN